MQKFILLFSFLILCPVIQSQTTGFEFDYAQFGYDSTSNYVELYYLFDQGSMQTTLEDNQKFTEGLLSVVITDSAKGDTIVSNQWVIKHPLPDSTNNGKQSLVGLVSFILPEGALKCEISGKDILKEEAGKTITDFIRVKPFQKGKLNISDIQLASKMLQGSENKNSIFYKNTFEIIPIPNLVFGENQPVMFFYSEIYNIQDAALSSDNLKLNELLFNSRGQIIKEKNKLIQRTVNSRVEVGSFVLSALPTDTYTLAITLIDSAKNFGVSSSKRFFVYNPSIQISDTSISTTTLALSSMFGAMSEEELDDLFAKSEYLASNIESDKYEKLTNENGKREFLYEFWKLRDRNPATPENEFFYDYLQRIEICNNRFSSMTKPGWKTDRGRVYLLYNEPSEIERYPNQLESRPYEIWQYNDIEGGVYFVFADLTGFSEYTLVHSTKRGELRDDNWGRRIMIAR